MQATRRSTWRMFCDGKLEMSFESSSDSWSTSSSSSETSLQESCSEDSIATCSEESFCQESLSEKEWRSPSEYSSESLNMSFEGIISDDDDDNIGVPEVPKKKAPKCSAGKERKSPIFIPDGDYGDDIIFVEPEDYSPKKKRRLEEEKRTVAIDKSLGGKDSEIAVTFDRKGIDFPHAREHCRVKKFVHNPSTTTKNETNEEYCEKCYCYVCDDLSSKCKSWKTGEKPHCNAYAKHAFWEQERRLNKRNIKRLKFVPILTLLSPGKITKEMSQSAAACDKYITQVQEVSNASYDMTPSNSCTCNCHGDPFLASCGCFSCEWKHRSNYSPYRYMYGISCKLRDIIYNATILAESFWKKQQLNSTIIVLDTITSLLFGLDIDRSRSELINFVSEINPSKYRLVSLWIEAALCKSVDQDLLMKAKERISKLSKDKDQIFHSKAKKLKRILSELKPYDDPQLVKCLTQKHKGTCATFQEHFEIAEVRLRYFEQSERFSEAINYMLATEVFQSFSERQCTDRLCDLRQQRKELVDLLIKAGRAQEALNVCSMSYITKLTADFKKTVTTRDNYETPIRDLSFDVFKKLFLALVQPQTEVANNKNSPGNVVKDASSVSEEGLRNAMTVILPGIYLNYDFSLREFFELVCDLISTQHKNYQYVNSAVRKDVQLSASKFLDTKVKKGVYPFQTTDIKPPNNVPFQVYIFEILVLVASAKLSVHTCLQSLVRKKLYWACVSLIVSPQVQDTMKAFEVEYFTKNILPKIDTREIPMEIFESWFKTINAMLQFKLLYKLCCEIYDNGTKKKGPEGVALRKKAVLLSQKLVESLLIHSHGHDRNLIERHLAIVGKKFSSETAKALGLTTLVWGPVEIEFILNPSFQSLESVKSKLGKANEKEFLKKRETLFEYLKRNIRVHQEASIDIFSKLEMYKDLKDALNSLDGPNDYEKNFTKINSCIEEVKQAEDKTKALTLAEALEEYVAASLVGGSFSTLFKKPISPIPPQIRDCVKLFHGINRGLFKSVIQLAINEVSQKYLRNTVSYQKRSELCTWLFEIKYIFIAVYEKKEWLKTMETILQGPLKRKPQIISTLRNATNLF